MGQAIFDAFLYVFFIFQIYILNMESRGGKDIWLVPTMIKIVLTAHYDMFKRN